MKLLTLLAALCCTCSVMAQEKIDTDRPDQTESAFLVPARWLQFELGLNQQGTRNSSERAYLLPTLLSKYAVNKNFELRLITTIEGASATGSKIQTADLAPVQLGAKVRICEEKGLLPKTSLIFHVGMPWLASSRLQGGNLAPNFRFTMQNSITDNIAIGYNLGAEWDGFSSNPAWIYTLAPGFNLGERWYAYVEAFGFITRGAPPEHSLDAGIAWYATNDFKIDLSGGGAVSKAAPPYYFSLGASVRFNTARKKQAR